MEVEAVNNARDTVISDITLIETELSAITSRLPTLMDLTAHTAPIIMDDAPLGELLYISEHLRGSVNRLSRHLNDMDECRLNAVAQQMNLSVVSIAVSLVAALLAELHRMLERRFKEGMLGDGHEQPEVTGKLVSSITYMKAPTENRAPRIRPPARRASSDNIIKPEGAWPNP